MTDLSALLLSEQERGALDPGNGLDVIEFDVVTTESHQRKADVTTHPVEQGSNIADHVHLSPDSLTMTAVVTRHPIRYLPSQFESHTRDLDAYQALVALHKSRTPVRVVTSLGVYESMVMTSLDVTRDLTTRTTIVAQMSFTHVRIVTGQTVELNTAAAPHHATTDGGTRPTKPAQPAQSAAAKDSIGLGFL
jgi:hypothetical protein